MDLQLNIPKKINVGFQKRKDTYTGRLAFVIYTDNKGKLKKEKSWNGWRDPKIPAVEHDNTPTSGFVLNKKVGGYGGWNPRQTWFRVYDPRGFEFEISAANLLFILEVTSSIKGKGLEGDFVYAWDGADLLLLPVGTPEYTSSASFTDLQTKKVTQKEMKEGCVYLTKDQQQYLYLGRHDFYQLHNNYGYPMRISMKHSKCHVFVTTDGKTKYWTQTGFTKLAQRLSEDPSPAYAEEYTKFQASAYSSPPVKLVGKLVKLDIEKIKKTYYGTQHCIQIGKAFHQIEISSQWKGNEKDPDVFQITTYGKIAFSEKGIKVAEGGGRERKNVTLEEIQALKVFSLHFEAENGATIHIDELDDHYDDYDEGEDDDDYYDENDDEVPAAVMAELPPKLAAQVEVARQMIDEIIEKG